MQCRGVEEVEQQTTDTSTATIESKPIQMQKGGGGRGRKRKYIDINEILRDYLPMRLKKARKFVLYLHSLRAAFWRLSDFFEKFFVLGESFFDFLYLYK